MKQMALLMALVLQQSAVAGADAPQGGRLDDLPDPGTTHIAGARVELDLDSSSGRPMVEVTVNGRGPYRFVVDTGAPIAEDYGVIESAQPNPAVADSLAGGDLEWLRKYARHYVRRVTEGRYPLMVWPYHAMLGSIGHALVSAVDEPAAQRRPGVLAPGAAALQRRRTHPGAGDPSAVRRVAGTSLGSTMGPPIIGSTLLV